LLDLDFFADFFAFAIMAPKSGTQRPARRAVESGRFSGLFVAARVPSLPR
jgi:hypothetical protein